MIGGCQKRLGNDRPGYKQVLKLYTGLITFIMSTVSDIAVPVAIALSHAYKRTVTHIQRYYTQFPLLFYR